MAKRYSDIRSIVREAITSGRYKPNEWLPPDHELAREMQTSRLTVHRALQGLAREGLVHRSPRRGTRVADPRKDIVGTVAVLLPAGFTGRTADWLDSLGTDLLEAGITVAPYNCHGTVSRAVQVARLLVRNPIVGVVLMPPTYEDSRRIVEIFQDARVPVVVEGKFEVPGLEVSYVSANHRQGGRLLAEHLLKRGHRRMATVSCSHTQDVQERGRGFREGLAAAGVELEENCTFEVRRFNEILYVVREMMNRPERPSVIFGLNDLIAAEVMAVLHQIGLRIPQDCAVVGMGDEPMSKATISPMTTARAPLVEEGHLLASILLNTIQGRLSEPQRIELDYELVVRQSCGQA